MTLTFAPSHVGARTTAPTPKLGESVEVKFIEADQFVWHTGEVITLRLQTRRKRSEQKFKVRFDTEGDEVWVGLDNPCWRRAEPAPAQPSAPAPAGVGVGALESTMALPVNHIYRV